MSPSAPLPILRGTDLKRTARTTPSRQDALTATPARFAFLSPKRFPILSLAITELRMERQVSTHRTEVAIPRAYGAWKKEEEVEMRID